MFVYDLVIYLWPALPFTADHTSDGIFTPVIIYPVLANMVVFALLGLMVGTATRRGVPIALTYSIVCVSSLLFWWWVEKELVYVIGFAFLTAMLFYAIPLWLVARANAPIKASPANVTSGHT